MPALSRKADRRPRLTDSHLVPGPRRKGGARFTVEQLVVALCETRAPCRTLDFWIWWHAYGLTPTDRQVQLGLTNRGPLPSYTASVDAAKTIVPAGYAVVTEEHSTGCVARLTTEAQDPATYRREVKSGWLLACALVACALQARMKQ